MPSPKCIVFKKQDLTDEQLTALAAAVPLASECLKCERRKDGKLEKICYIQL
jgi:hypothetical protein